MFDYLEDTTVLDGLNWLEETARFDAASEVWEMVIRQRYRLSIWKMQAGTEDEPIDWYTLDFYKSTDAWAFDFADDETGEWESLGSRTLGTWEEVMACVVHLAAPSVVLHKI